MFSVCGFAFRFSTLGCLGLESGFACSCCATQSMGNMTNNAVINASIGARYTYGPRIHRRPGRSERVIIGGDSCLRAAHPNHNLLWSGESSGYPPRFISRMRPFRCQSPTAVGWWHVAETLPSLCQHDKPMGSVACFSVSYTHLTLPTIYSV